MGCFVNSAALSLCAFECDGTDDRMDDYARKTRARFSARAWGHPPKNRFFRPASRRGDNRTPQARSTRHVHISNGVAA